MPAYEYLSVGTVTKTNWADIAPLPAGERPAQWFKRYALIWWPDSKVADERELDERGSTPVFNELGRLGWQLVQQHATYTTIYDYTNVNGSDWYGHKQEIGTPLMFTAIFMREVAQ